MFFSLNKPLFLILWILIPVLWFMLHRSFTTGGLSRHKKIVIGLRSLLVFLLGLALCDPQLLIRSDQVNLLFCLDVSESIPGKQKKAAEAFIKKTTAGMKNEDQAGVIVFGKHPSIEISLQKEFDSLVMRSDVTQTLPIFMTHCSLPLENSPRLEKIKLLYLAMAMRICSNPLTWLTWPVHLELRYTLCRWRGGSAKMKPLSKP